jgi:hypothetical protein
VGLSAVVTASDTRNAGAARLTTVRVRTVITHLHARGNVTDKWYSCPQHAMKRCGGVEI